MFFKTKPRHLRTGARGERAAALYLLLRGYRILNRNYLCPGGEIDIVAMRKGVIIFVEVRTRHPDSLADPMASISDMKLAHFTDAARFYLTAKGKTGSRCRFDIISVRSGGPWRGRIRHHVDAFWTSDERAVGGKSLKTWIRRQPRTGRR